MRERNTWLAVAIGLIILPLAWWAGENKTVAALLGLVALLLLLWGISHAVRQAWLDRHPRSTR